VSPRFGLPKLGKGTGHDAAVPEAAGESVTESPIAAEPVTESVAIERVTEAAAAKPAAAKPAASAVPPEPADAEPVEPEPAGVHARTSAEDGLTKLAEYKRAVLSWVAEDGYPVNVDVEIEVKLSEGTVRFAEPAGFKIPAGTLDRYWGDVAVVVGTEASNGVNNVLQRQAKPDAPSEAAEK